MANITECTDAIEKVGEARTAVESLPTLVGQTPDQLADVAAAAESTSRALAAMVEADRHLRAARALLHHAKASEPKLGVLAG